MCTFANTITRCTLLAYAQFSPTSAICCVTRIHSLYTHTHTHTHSHKGMCASMNFRQFRHMNLLGCHKRACCLYSCCCFLMLCCLPNCHSLKIVEMTSAGIRHLFAASCTPSIHCNLSSFAASSISTHIYINTYIHYVMLLCVAEFCCRLSLCSSVWLEC